MNFRRLIQTISLLTFLFLLIIAASSAVTSGNLDIFLRLDPVIALGSIISSRSFAVILLPTIIVILITPIIGRIFCGYICPMGTTVDCSDRLFGNRTEKCRKRDGFFIIKYLVLLFIVGSALLGVSFVFIASPISLITRFYGLLVYPVASLFGHTGLILIQPIAEKFDLNTILFIELMTPRYPTQFFILVFFIFIFSAAIISPRFWCRYICPSGALLAILSLKPILKRSVSDECIECGKCSENCPMNAIPKEEPLKTRHGECIVCHNCEKVCPVNAVSFRAGNITDKMKEKDFLPSRRQFMLAGFSGFGVAAVNLSGLNSLYGKPGVGQVLPQGLVRPPGAKNEKVFLALCVRCGECMVACPNNALHPLWLKGGVAGLFSPALIPKRGACSPECNNCGNLCPTGAIRSLPLEERRWAKTGTAMILKEKCLAWEHQKRCMVCDEVCPYNAVRFRNVTDNPVPVPEVLEERCSGCGYCEYHCPVLNQSAIIVTPMGSLRLNEGSFMEQGKQQGLDISLRHKGEKTGPTGGEYPYDTTTGYGEAPGFDEDDSEGTAPGFTD